MRSPRKEERFQVRKTEQERETQEIWLGPNTDIIGTIQPRDGVLSVMQLLLVILMIVMFKIKFKFEKFSLFPMIEIPYPKNDKADSEFTLK